MIGRVRESRNPKKVIRVALMESYGEIGRVPVNLSCIEHATYPFTAPNMVPSTRYFCTKGTTIMIGMTDTTMHT